MKVAIMGAGLSGLACAIRLERYGITPTIFEKRSQVGDRFINGEALLSIFSRPISDEIAYLSEKYGIYLHPVGNIKEVIVQSAHTSATLNGHFGFSNLRGRHKDSFENQLAKQLQTDIQFHSEETYENLIRDYTHVIVATGDAAYTRKISHFRTDAPCAIFGATVEGDFSRYTVRIWFNNDFAPFGYGFFLPYSEKEASIAVAIPRYHEIPQEQKDAWWQRFLLQVREDLGQDLPTTDEFSIDHYEIGICENPRIGNTFFTGNCFGALMPLFGFGQFTSILTGIYAADDLLGFSKYEESTQVIRRAYRRSLAFRRLFETMDNGDWDVVVDKLQGYWGKKLLTTKTDVLKWASYAVRLWLAGRSVHPKRWGTSE